MNHTRTMGVRSLPLLNGTRESQAVVLNVFGGPGCGKSTLCASLFAGAKKAGIEAACPEEHAKLAIWSGRPWLLDEQVVISGKIWETTINLSDKVDLIIMDSPILLCSVYAGDREPQPFHDLIVDLHKRSKRLNVLLTRNDDRDYSVSGRREDYERAITMDGLITERLDALGEPYLAVRSGDDEKGIVRTILSDIIEERPRLY